MQQDISIHKPTKVNLDADPKYISNDSAFYLLNNERSVNSDGTLGKNTPLAGNELVCQMAAGIGQNYCVGAYRSELTNENYFFQYNTEGVNFILRVNADSTCQIVYQGDCLPLSANPENYIADWRVYMKYDLLCAHRHGKQLVWVDGSDNPIGMLDVEASIATNNFSTAFFNNCPDPCAALQMCVPEICGAPQGEFIPLDPADVDLSNKILDVGIQVRVRHIYYDERASSWSDISSLFYQNSKGCFGGNEGFPRCIKFTLPIGNPLVDKIQIAYSKNNGTTWYLSDTIEKYSAYTSQSQYWYQRTLLPLLNYNATDCTFDYIFCNDKDCETIDPNETNRVFNPMPRSPQGLIRIKDSLGFYNYIKGNCPVSEAETKKIQIELSCATTVSCPDDIIEITVRAIIHNNTTNKNQYIYREAGGGNQNLPDDKTDRAYFGGMGQFANYENSSNFNQSFEGETRNFIVYVDGTDTAVEMKQRRAQANFVGPVDYGVVSSASSSLPVNGVPEFCFQEAKIKVKKGSAGFLRLVDHKQTNGLEAAQNTSTLLFGTITTLTNYNGNKNIFGEINSGAKEIYFDTCGLVGNSLVIDETFVIQDSVVHNGGGNHTSSAFQGYVTDNGNKPVYGAEIWFGGVKYAITDHNGFYFFYLYGSPNTDAPINVELRVEVNCAAFQQVKAVVLDGAYQISVSNNIKIATADNPNYENISHFTIVKIKVRDCNNAVVAGVRVTLTGSKSDLTDSLGQAEFKVRNIFARNRVVRGIVMNTDYCISLTCENACNPCMPKSLPIALPACFTGTTIQEDVVGFINRATSVSTSGLKAGGRYKWAAVVQGGCGRISAAYPVTIKEGLILRDNYLNVPKTQNKGGLSFCDLSYNVAGFVPPVWGDCLKIVRTKNLNNYELQWIVDKIERTADNKIKLTIQTLNDYNALYNFETNTFYEYLKGDRVEFINNGDGTIFDVTTFGLLNYQILSPFHDKILSGEETDDVKFFNQILIEDDGKLSALKEGAKIEIQRPDNCTEENTPYFEIGLSLAIVDGAVVDPSGSFQTFDTYFVNRQIGKYPSQRFESKNPSDFWGDKLLGVSDIGKVHFENKYENEKRFGRNITVNTQNQFNRFGDFEKTLDAPEQGDLTAMFIYDGKLGMGIGANDSFLFQVSNDFLRVDNNGVVRAVSSDQLISDAEPKISGIFGCNYQDIGSVIFGDGFVQWVDSKRNAYVKHDFNIAKDISLGKFKSWIGKKVQRINFLNNTQSGVAEYRWVTGINEFTNAVILSVKKLTDPSINNSQAALSLDYETMLIDYKSDELLGFASFVYESYTTAKLFDGRGAAFLGVKNGDIYKFPINPITWNTFHGVSCDWVVGISVNKDPSKIKIPLAAEIQSEQSFFVSKVETDKVGFLSEIPAVRFKKAERKWNAHFLYNKNARGGLYGTDENTSGESARGYFIKVTLVRDNTLNLAYNTIDANKQRANGNLDMVLIKFLTSDSSGFNNT